MVAIILYTNANPIYSQSNALYSEYQVNPANQGDSGYTSAYPGEKRGNRGFSLTYQGDTVFGGCLYLDTSHTYIFYL